MLSGGCYMVPASRKTHTYRHFLLALLVRKANIQALVQTDPGPDVGLQFEERLLEQRNHKLTFFLLSLTH